MRIPTGLWLTAFASLAAILAPTGVVAELKIEPPITKAYPRAEASDDPLRKPRTRRVPAGDTPPAINFGLHGIKCAAASDLCAWKRIPDPWSGPRGYFSPARPQRQPDIPPH